MLKLSRSQRNIRTNTTRLQRPSSTTVVCPDMVEQASLLKPNLRCCLSFVLEVLVIVIFILTLIGIIGLSPKVRKALQLLRLRQLHNGTFLRVNKATLGLLKLVEPYVTYGSPSLNTVRRLLYKRGFARINGQRIPIVENRVISGILFLVWL